MRSAAALLLPLLAPGAAAASAPRPNVLILFVDDWGWGDLGANCFAMGEVPGARPDRLDKQTACDSATNRTLTPALDRLAAKGLRFTDHHATGVCTPSRSQLQTGRMGARTGVSSNFAPGSLGGLPQSEKTVATLVKAAGFVTCAIGKWHMGVKPGFNPLDHGYDHFLGLPESNDYGCTDSSMGAPDSGCLDWRADRCPRNRHDSDPKWDGPNCHPGPRNPWNYSLPLLHGRSVIQQPADLEGSASPDAVPISFRYAQFGADFIANSSAAQRKFLLYVAWSHMHVPLVHSRAFQGKSGIGPLGDCLMEVDTAAGTVLEALEKNGVADDTLVFLTGDNGPPEDQCDWGGSKGPFLGSTAKTAAGGGGSAGKLTSWEGGHREVGVAVWPGKIPAGSVSHVLSTTMDYLPTIAALAGVPLPTDRGYDGMDLAPVLFRGAKTHHPHLFFSVGGESYGSVPGGKPCKGGKATCPLFEAVRTERFSAMFMVGYMGSCCRSPTSGDANTPYNSSCANSGATDPALGVVRPKTWLETPLLFDLSVDVAQAEPLAPASPLHAEALRAIEAAVAEMRASLVAEKLISKPNYRSDLSKAECCNRDNVVCRCEELPSLKTDDPVSSPQWERKLAVEGQTVGR